MRSFFLGDSPLCKGTTIVLPTPLRHHLDRVLRLSPGTVVRLFDGDGRVAEAVLQPDGHAHIRETFTSECPQCRIELIQGLAKGDKTELILQKGTELGVSTFHLVTMERSVARFKPNSRQQQRWEKTIQEAARQSGQYHLPEFRCSDSLESAIDADTTGMKLLLWEQAEVPLAEVLAGSSQPRISIIVGPEGGVSEAEAALAQACGYRPVRLGRRILRTETAGLAIIAILQYLYGDLSCGYGSIETTHSYGKDIS